MEDRVSDFDTNQGHLISPSLFVRLIGWGQERDIVLSVLFSELFDIEVSCKNTSTVPDEFHLEILIDDYEESIGFTTIERLLETIEGLIEKTYWLDGELDTYTVVFEKLMVNPR